MTIFDFFQFLGGLSLFLFGMMILGDGLKAISGGRLEQLLRRFTSNRFKGVFLGAGVTALIQSSSAASVMVVALVNAGVMKLTQAVSVIMGANIGTTITAWVLSLTGLSSDNFFIQMLKPSSFSPLMALIGLIMLLTGKTETRRSKAYGLLGFAVLMFGMETMTGSVSGLQNVPEFVRLFEIFTNPVVGILFGAIVTAAVQSSSASVGILQALSATGAITFGSAVPIIMGQNIGTCITAMLSSIGGDRNAKRAAMIHLTFNAIGSVLFISGFYLIHALWPFGFMGDVVTPINIAILHTIFNLVTTALLLPFSNHLVKLSQVLIRDTDQEHPLDVTSDRLRLLDPRFLDRPGIAVQQAHTVMNHMMAEAVEAMNMASVLLVSFTEELYDRVETLEQMIDRYEDALGEYLIQISAEKLSEPDSHKLTIMMHSLNDIERIGDHAINLADQARKKHQAPDPFSASAEKQIDLFVRAVKDILQRTMTSLNNLDIRSAYYIEPLEDRINEINKELTSLHIDRLRTGDCTIEKGLVIAEVYNNLERVADHCSNIGICITQFSTSSYRPHDFEASLNKQHPEYVELYQQYVEQYPLNFA